MMYREGKLKLRKLFPKGHDFGKYGSLDPLGISERNKGPEESGPIGG
jgi:hypothetical protein